MNNNIQLFQIDFTEYIEVNNLPKIFNKKLYKVKKDIKFICSGYNFNIYNSLYEVKNNSIYEIINNANNDVVLLKLFLLKYKNFNEFRDILSDLYIENKDELLKKIMFLFEEIDNLDDLKKILEKFHSNKEYKLGDSLIIVDDKDKLGSIKNIYGIKSQYILNIFSKYKDIKKSWERGIIYNEEKSIYEFWFKNDIRDNKWYLEIKFYDKELFFKYILAKEFEVL